MSQELVYTSVPTGLNPGSKGFCTVAITAGLGATWSEKLESLSGYRPILPPGDPNSSRNPINFSHWRINLGGKMAHQATGVAFAGTIIRNDPTNSPITLCLTHRSNACRPGVDDATKRIDANRMDRFAPAVPYRPGGAPW